MEFHFTQAFFQRANIIRSETASHANSSHNKATERLQLMRWPSHTGSSLTPCVSCSSSVCDLFFWSMIYVSGFWDHHGEVKSWGIRRESGVFLREMQRKDGFQTHSSEARPTAFNGPTCRTQCKFMYLRLYLCIESRAEMIAFSTRWLLFPERSLYRL